MGSSSETSKRHKKSSKKHKKRSRSHSRTSNDCQGLSDVHYENMESENIRHHSHHRSSKYREEYEERLVQPKSRSRSLDGKRSSKEKERRHKHRHKKHKERRHERHHRDAEPREEQNGHTKKRAEVISITVENSDSDSSDCVEVPLDVPPDQVISNRSAAIQDIQLVAPPPPTVSKRSNVAKNLDQTSETVASSSSSSRRLERTERDVERERRRERDRDRDREVERERGKDKDRERERDRDRDRERSERENFERERSERERERDRDRDHERDRHRATQRSSDQSDKRRHFERSPSPIPENGAGDSLSIEETNKIRLKLGLKPLEVSSGPTAQKSSLSDSGKKAPGEKNLSAYKDEWGEFLHKPAENLKEKAEANKIREKLNQKKEKRFVENRLKCIRTLGESDDEVDDLSKWVTRNKKIVDQKSEAEKRAKALEEMDAEFGVDELVEKEKKAIRRKAYSDKHLRGLRVDHDMDEFDEGKTVILTLKDKGVLDEDEDGDTLINVNMIDEERYRKNVENKKLNPLSYGYNVYEEMYDELGNPIDRGILEKYDEDIDGGLKKKKAFVIGENLEEEREHRRKLLEIKTKLAGKRLETLADTRIQLASDTFSEVEIAKFKKPKKKVKKVRQKLKAEDLLPLVNEPVEQHFGNRRKRLQPDTDDNDNQNDMTIEDEKVKLEMDDEDDLQRVLSKARKLKQKELIIKKPVPTEIKQEVKRETGDESDDESVSAKDGNIVLNATAEFCRTLGDIPTYGMAGNRDEDSNDMMDFEITEAVDERKYEEPEASTGTWNSVNPEDVMRPMDDDDTSQDLEDVAILDEEPDVGAGVGNALRLALSKGYLEKEDTNRPSNTKMAHLQAKNYSIEDKSAGDDEKFGRRDRFHAGPIMDFRDKDSFKPNVKLEYIDDNGRILNLKEAFRYLSHKFHGKGPGKNKIEKRLKKMQQDGLMKTMSSTDTPLGTLTMLQQKQRETKTPYVVLSGGKQTAAAVSSTTISKYT